MNRCENHKFREISIPLYKADLLGIEGVYVRDAVRQERCERCGAAGALTIPNLQGLIAAVAVRRATIPFKLHGKEIRFLREALELSAQDLARNILSLQPAQISRWEHDVEPIGPRSEKVLRLYVVDQLARRTALTVDRNAIYSMRIKPWRALDNPIRMEFFQVKKPVAKLTKKKLVGKWQAAA